ncbi:MAG: 2-amino-4-hydroxy-6-hydroxymethyldihydropteridine diphosphokinase [Gammaproteobacteria bacterium]|nr:2-amino-4-hydroxy-6-hydroxymethyldihydropteridine diphosphokinase [Gammaproteobacteria bacterium]
MAIAYIGLGSNLGDPARQLTDALRELTALPGTTLVTQSSFYRSKALGQQDQPDYINAAARLETSLPAVVLMQELLGIERRHGRVRGSERWQARTLDLDLLLYDQDQIMTEGLVVPHPEIAKRNFVLMPLAEITPDLDIPGLGRVSDMLARIGRADIEKID